MKKLLSLTLIILASTVFAQSPAIPGEITVELTISEKGKIVDAKPLDTDLPPQYTESAIKQAVKYMKYSPEIKDGVPVPSKKIVKIKLAPKV